MQGSQPGSLGNGVWKGEGLLGCCSDVGVCEWGWDISAGFHPEISDVGRSGICVKRGDWELSADLECSIVVFFGQQPELGAVGA